VATEDFEIEPLLKPAEALQLEFAQLFPRMGQSKDALTSVAMARKGPSALCLSGGGIRSATFSLGVLQALSDSNVLGRFDYLSTVSGGGYIGAWLSRWRAGEHSPPPGQAPYFGEAAEALKETPDDTRPPEHPLRRLRSFSNYLSPSWGLSTDTLTVASIFLRNLLLNLLFWIPLLLLVAMLPWLITTIARFLVSTDGFAIRGRVFDFFDLGAFAVPTVAAAIWTASALLILFLGWWMNEEWRERISRFTAPPLLIGILWLLLFSAFAFLPWFLLVQIRDASAGESATAIAGGGLFAILTGMAGYWSRYGPDLRKKAYGVADVFGARLLDLLALLALFVFAVTATLAMRAWLRSWPVPTTGPVVYWIQAEADARMFLYTAIGLAFIVAAAGFFVGANRFSLHALYGNRLVRAYLGSARRSRNPSPATDFDPRDNVNMSALPGGNGWPKNLPPRPFHVVNMTLNLARSRRDELDWQERKGASFTATPIHCGSPATGYVRSESFGGADDRGQPTGMTLGRAMTISGAAASPNMGYHGSPLMALVMTFFNIRLGWWVPNPMWIAQRDTPLLRQEPLYGLRYVLKEAFSGTNRHSNWLYLSDGGHFDNLGLYEMVRRRCRRIVVVDAGCDGEFKHADLHNAIRKIAVDLAVPIDFEADLPGQKGPAERQRIAVGTIRYSALNRAYRNGKLFLVKPILVGDEPPSLREYAEVSRRNGKTFPHHSTADQFFNETQFESYRRLGEWSVADLLVAIRNSARPGGPAIPPEPKPPTPEVLPPPPEAPSDLPPPARLTGLSGIEAGVRALSPVQMVAGALATAGAVGAAATVGHKAADQLVEVVWPPNKGVISAELDSEARKLLEQGVTVRADVDSLRRIDALKERLNQLLGDQPPGPPDIDGTAETQLAIEVRNIATLLDAHARERFSVDNVKASLDHASLQPVVDRLARLENLETTNGRALGAIISELRTIAARLQDSNRRNVRGR
jgi:hypothetical protein